MNLTIPDLTPELVLAIVNRVLRMNDEPIVLRDDEK